MLGHNKHAGVRIASRCLWDTDTDNHASASYKSVRPAAAVFFGAPRNAPAPAPRCHSSLIVFVCAISSLQDTIWATAMVFGLYTE